ncbi:MAG: hypothetical protein M1365_13460, partial [Actinobacteria bacterium]|nr:hypothetical protein [Actinomycetota bacterium]
LAALRIAFSKRKVFLSISLALGAVLGLLGSLYFWLPAISESKLMKYETVYNFGEHFPYFRQFLIPFWGYGASIPGIGDGMSFYLGTASILVILLGLISAVLFWNKYLGKQKVLIIWSILSLLFALFMMNNKSTFIWKSVPLVPYFQFPWRFLIVTTFVIPVFVVLLEKIKSYQILSLTIILFTLFSSYQYFHPQDFLRRTDQYFLARYIPTPVAQPVYYTQNEEYLRLPKESQMRPDKNFPLAVAENADIKNSSINNNLNFDFQVESKDKGLLTINKYLFPGWQAKVNGKSVPILSGYPYGQITIPLKPGSNKVNIFYNETGTNKILDIISLLAFLSALYLSLNLSFLKSPRGNNIVSR